ncbi:hypothetical protein Tco_1181058, partial [Tanacetum coccineum]
MLVQPTQEEGASSERLSEEQPSPSPAPTSEVPNESLPDSSSAQPSEVPFEQQPDPSPSPSPRPSPNPSPTPIVPDSIPEHTGENLGDHSSNDTSLSGNEDAMTLQNVYDLCLSLCKQVSDQAKEIKLLKAKITKLKKKANPVIKHFKAYQKRVSMQQRQQRKRFSKKKRVQKESVSKQGRKNAKGDGKAKENAQSEGRTKEMMDEDKENDEVGLSTEDEVSTAKEGVSTDKERLSTDFEKVSTDRPKLSTDGFKVSTDEQMEGPDEQVEASEEIFESTKDQGEGTEVKVESTAEQRKGTEEQIKEEFAAQVESERATSRGGRRRLAEERSEDDDNSLAKSNSNSLKTDEEMSREQFTIEERAKFLHDTIAAQRKFLAQQRSQAIRNKPPTKNQLRNQMMTYIKHVGNYKHADLKSKKFEELSSFRMNEKGAGLSKSEVIKEETKEEVKVEDKGEESTRKRKLGTRKKMKSRKRRYIQHTSEDDTDKENDELRLCLKISQDEDKETDYEILNRKYPIIDWKTKCLGTKPQPDEAKTVEEINLNVVTRSNGQQRYFSVLTSVFSILDREDLNAIYQLVMNKYQDQMPEGFERVLWGDLIVLFNPDEKDEYWSSQQEWKVISWKLHSSSGVHTLMTNEGVVIHMLKEKKYPLKKEILVQMLNLRLEFEEESTMALELIRFIKKILADLESKEQ